MSQVERVSRRLWSDGFYEWAALPTLVPGVLLAIVLMGLLLTLGNALGAFERLAEEGLTWWQSRDGRIAVTLALLAGVVPTALRYHELGTRRDLEALVRSQLWPDGLPSALRRATLGGSPRVAIAFGLSGFLLIPLIAYTVDRDFGLYFSRHYWGFAQLWTWSIGCFVTFFGGILTYRVYADARGFARLARSLPEVNLLERDALLPFARQGLRSAVPGVIFATFLMPNVADEGFVVAIVVVGSVVLVQNVATLLLPLRGLRDRLRATKREELTRVNAAVQGEPGALAGSLLARRDDPSLSDLLAWRRFVESVPEWPIDTSTLGRFAFFVGLPLLSWVGAALVERALDLVIG